MLTGKQLYEDEEDLIRQMGTDGLEYCHRFHQLSNKAKDFVRSLLSFCPKQRPTARQAVAHPWLHCTAPEEAAQAQHLVEMDLRSTAATLGIVPHASRRLALKALGLGILTFAWLSIW